MKKNIVVKSYSVLILTLITFLYGCNEVTSVCDPQINLETTGANLSSFKTIQEKVFTPNCALSGCHAGSFLQANLDLSEGNAYSNLINMQSLLNPGYKRILPGNSGDSFLIRMLRNSGPGTSLMPPTGKLNDAIIDSIALWIDAGATNN